MARLTRGTRRLDWLSGRIEVAEILAAQGDTATPDRLEKGPHLGLTTGPLADRRTTRQPTPTRRIRPADTETAGTAAALYGARAVIPWPYRDISVAGAADATIAGAIVVEYLVPEFVQAARANVVLNRSAASVALVVTLSITRGGREFLVRVLGNADLELTQPITLQRGDRLRAYVSTAGAAATVYGFISAQERI